jgi:pimeloyl-ACP methyl ester carboxylesterase
MTATPPVTFEKPERLDPSTAWRLLGLDGANNTAALAEWPWMRLLQQGFDYWVDAWQRSVLFLDVMRRRGNGYFEHSREAVPHVLTFAFEPVMRGSDLDRPVNYGLVQIVTPPDVAIDARKRPFIVFDPRAGHGPGIGGMKADSEIGVALSAGHPCYFVGFTPNPVPGQTVEDVCRAEALFVQKVIDRHPDAEGKPCLIGNCQAGWQIMMMAATRPDLVGPIMLAGSPLSYWAGVRGKNPMRYTGGLLGGTWLASLAGDLGHGLFDGAHLVANFEELNPANTYWEKSYNLYSKIDTEAPRFLEFERWWGSPVLLNAEEMQFIADELFVGNKLASGEIYFSDGVRVDLRNIKSPIIVFCSRGDNITPPQQALGWILDLYDSEDEIIANGQTIIYSLHQTIGHLGVFVSAKVATKEHEQFAHTMDMIDVLPPGLYEAVMTEKAATLTHAELVSGNYLVRFEARTLDAIRALGGNDDEDERRFATVARVSAITQGLYRTCLSPLVRQMASDYSASWLRRMHPHRIRFEAFSDRNPLLGPVAQMADAVRAQRRPAATENPFLALQKAVAEQITDALDGYRDLRDQMYETLFLTVYGSPILQATVGLRSDEAISRRRIGRDVTREAAAARAAAEIETHIARGGPREAALRALIYVALGRSERWADQRGFAMLRQMQAEQPESRRMSLGEFKDMAREQYLMLRLDAERAVDAIPQLLLPASAEERTAVLARIHRVIDATGDLSGEAKKRLARIEALITNGQAGAAVRSADDGWNVAADRPSARKQPRSEAAAAAARPARVEKAPGA